MLDSGHCEEHCHNGSRNALLLAAACQQRAFLEHCWVVPWADKSVGCIEKEESECLALQPEQSSVAVERMECQWPAIDGEQSVQEGTGSQIDLNDYHYAAEVQSHFVDGVTALAGIVDAEHVAADTGKMKEGMPWEVEDKAASCGARWHSGCGCCPKL